MKIVNLTQHLATKDQISDGVIEPFNKEAVQEALTFELLPTLETINERAITLARIAIDSGCKKAMIGGAPYLMSVLERVLLDKDIIPVYSFTVRQSVEIHDNDGNVKKTNVFKHVGFVEVS